jgi:hypothetical protein
VEVSKQPERRILADNVVAGLSMSLVGKSHGEVAVRSLLSYGAVDIDPKHLVVWVLLDGPPSNELPAWFAPADGEWSADPQQSTLDPDLVTWMRDVREEIRAAFDHSDWPSAQRVSVVFDSAERVEEAGFNYFRG